MIASGSCPRLPLCALPQLAFWIISVPLAIGGVALTTGSIPDLSTTEGQEATAGYSLAFLTFARVIVPVRIALALALTPWVKDNIMTKFGGGDGDDEAPAVE